MLTFKLSRTGKSRQPYFRLVLVEKARDPWGNALEILGNYDPRTKKAILNKERITYWIEHGAQATDTVHNLFISNDIIKGKTRSVSKLSKAYRAKLTKEKEAAAPTPVTPKAEEKK